MLRDNEKDKKALLQEVRALRSKLARLEPVEFKAGRAEHMSVEDVLRASDEKYRPLFDNMLNGLAYCRILVDENDRPVDFIYIDVNNAFEKLTGLKKEDILGKKVTEAIPGIKEAHPDLFDIYGEVALTGEETKFEVFFKPLKIWLFISVYSPARGYFVTIFENITKRKKAEEERDVTIKLLRLINSPNQMHELMRLVTVFLKDWSGCEAVGIRLAEGEDFPYFVTSGFPEEFVLAENRLCSVNEIGRLVRDSQGRPFLECMCGNVISGRFDPSKPFFTEHGSFWTNSTTDLLAGTTEADRLARTRNRCNTAGYESVALVPLRTGRETFGLLQFNDKQRGRFTPDRISLFERLADNLAIGLAQRRAEKKLQESEVRFRELFESMRSGAAVYEAIGDGEDFVFKDLNKAGERIEKIERAMVIGKRVTEAFPGIKKLGLFDVFQRVWRTGQPEYHPVSLYKDERLTQWVENHVYKLSSGEIVAVYGDVTERKQAEEKLHEYQHQLKSMAWQLSRVHEQERRNLAVEMHERVSQRLAMAKLSVQILAQSSADAEVSGKLRSTAQEIGQAVEDTYSLMLELSNPVLYEIGLKAAVEALLKDKIRPEQGIEYELAADDDFKLDDVINVPVYQAVRELLTNVIKHSRANKLVVDIHRTRDAVQVRVKDNGVGFDVTRTGAPIAGKEGGFGLFGIRENLEYINGKLEVKSEQGKGTVAIVTAPLEYKAEPGLGGQRP